MDQLALLPHADVEFERRLAAITPNQLQGSSPCEEWTGRDLVNHVVGESIMSVRLLHGASANEAMAGLDGDLLGDNPSTAFAAAACRPSAPPSRSPRPSSGSSTTRRWTCPGPAARVQDRRPHLARLGPSASRGRRRDARRRPGRGCLGAALPHGAVHRADRRLRCRPKRGCG